MKFLHLKYAVLIILIFWLLFYLISQIRITAEFEELEPFNHRLPVYYKGYHLGHTSKIYPSSDFKTTYVDLKIRLHNVKLPLNTTAVVRRKDRKEYIELVYPKEPYIEYLSHNSMILGKKGASFEKYIQDQAAGGGLDEIKENLNSTLVSVGTTFDALTEMIGLVSGILREVEPSIIKASKNIDTASLNLAETSLNIKTTMNENYFRNTLINLESATKGLSATTNGVNEYTVKQVNCILGNLNTLIQNINKIVVGVGCTLKKRFGGIRLLFGQANCE